MLILGAKLLLITEHTKFSLHYLEKSFKAYIHTLINDQIFILILTLQKVLS